MQNAILVSLKISQFVNSRNDIGITREVMAAHSLTGPAGRWVKMKLNPDALSGVRTAASKARAANYNLTLPWEDGRRLLPLTLRPQYLEQMTERRQEFQTAVAAFAAEYPERVEEAKRMHGTKFLAEDYPPAEVIADVFDMRTECTAVPAQSHLAEVVAGDALAEMSATLETENAKRMAAAEADIWERLLMPVRDLAAKLSDPDSIFRDSLVGNVGEILAIAPAFNLTGKPELSQAVEEIRTKLSSLNPEALRTNMEARRGALRAAGAIIQQFGAVGVRKIS